MKVDEGIGDCGCEHFRTGKPAHRANIGSRRDVLHAPPSGYERSELDVNIHIDPGYPDSRIDMVYLRPPLARADGRPIATLAQDRSYDKDLRRWNRLRTPDTPANPKHTGIDNRSTHFRPVEVWFSREPWKV